MRRLQRLGKSPVRIKIIGVGWSTSFFLEITSKGPVPNESYLLCRGVFIPHSEGTGAHRRSAARAAQRFDIHIQLLKVATQGIAVHAQFRGSFDLVPIHVTENCNEEGLLKLVNGFGL